MGPAQAINTGFAKSLKFWGRSSRSEFWWFAPGWMLVLIFVFFTEEPRFLMQGPLSGLSTLQLIFLFFVVLLVPVFAAITRRLQDAGLSGWITLVVPIYLLVAPAILDQLSQHAQFGLASPDRGVLGFLYLAAGYYGLIALLMFACALPTRSNKYGPNPLEVPK